MKAIEFLQNRIAGLNAQLSNGLSEDARAEVTKTIAGLEAAINEIKELQAGAEQGEADNSQELLSQVREIVARVQAVESELKTPRAENKVSRISNTKNYEKKFFEMVHNSFSRDDFKKNLKTMAVATGITIADGGISELLPPAVLNEVNDMFTGHRHRLLELVDWTGLPAFRALYESAGETGRSWPSPMLGQNASDSGKQNQNLEFEKILLRPQYIFKKVAIDKEIIRASEADGSVFIRYIVRELLDRLLCTIENLILLGGADVGGDVPNNASFLPPIAMPAVLDSSGNGKTLYHAMNYLPYSSSRDLIAIVNPALYINLKQTMAATYGYYISDEFMAKDFFGVNEVVMVPPGFRLPSYDWEGFMFMNPRNYKMVGDRRPDQFEDFNLEWNRVDYLMEMWVGGGSVTPEFVSVIESGGDS